MVFCQNVPKLLVSHIGVIFPICLNQVTNITLNTIRYLQHYPLTITITRRIRHNSDDSEDGALSSIDHNSVPIVEVEELLPPGEVEK